MRELWRMIVHTSGAKIYSMALGILSLSLTARLLGPEGRGSVATITTWVNLFCTFGYMSLGQVALHRISENRANPKLGAILGSLLTITGVITVMGWIVAISIYLFSFGNVLNTFPLIALIIGFSALPFLIWEQYSSSLLMALERLREYNRAQIVGRTVAVLIIFILVGGLKTGISGVLFANLIGQIIIATGGITFLISEIKRYAQKIYPDVSEIRSLFSGGAKLHLNAIGSFLFASSNILILNHYQGPAATGYFQLSTQLTSVLMIVPQSACMVIYGKVASLGANGAWPLNLKLILQITLITICLCLICGVTAPWWLSILAGNSFKQSIVLFQWMLLGVIGMTFSTLMAPQWIGRGYFLQAAAITLVVGLLNLGATFYLIPRFGTMGAVYALIGTYGVSAVSNGVMVIHCMKKYKCFYKGQMTR